ncbi:cysteine--tRNA ligase [Nonomuraea sp. NPDC048826]|uniref:cysteine--tRNA ligase n=1 Tax=Nonomuraea sp. NPDC048826 TaxID=3364347 RepID=UPI003717371C
MLRIYDTRARQVEEIAPARGLRMYACAPPVHRRAHLGDLRQALLSDLIRRVLERHRVRMVVCLGADDPGHPERAAGGFADDAAALNLRPPERSARAADHADQVIGLISRLIEQGHARTADGRVLFDAAASPSYGELSGKTDLETTWELWRPVDGEPAWDSPWGRGLPGPHAACSAMSLRLLGERIDILTGEAELIRPHHEAVRVQSDAVTGHEVVRHWVHGERLLVEGGEPPELAAVTGAGIDPLAVRLAFLERHYRTPLDLTWDDLRAADETVRRWRGRVAEWSESPSAPMAVAHVRRAEAALDDDLDTATALRVLAELEADDSVPPGAKFESFLHLDHVLAVDLSADIGKPRP